MLRSKVLVCLMLVIAGGSAFAEDAAPQKESDKLDIKKLEDKYWSAKDDDFSVVQNRAYAKDHRYFLTVDGGIPINDPYSTGSLYGLSAGYHFSERWGVEASYLKANFNNNDATSQFTQQFSAVPDHNTLNSMMGVQVDYVPLYAKMSLVDKKIIYFDMGIGLGVGQTAYSQVLDVGDKSQTAFDYTLSIYQQFFFSEHWALKVDYRNTWTNEDVEHWRSANGSRGSKSINDSALMLGLTFFK